MILAFTELRKHPLRLDQVAELEADALECLREVKRLQRYQKTESIDVRIERARSRFNRIQGVLISRAGLVIIHKGGNQWESVPVVSEAEDKELDRLEALYLEGPAPLVNRGHR